MRQKPSWIFLSIVLSFFATESLSAQSPAQARIRGPIDNGQLVRLRGNTHPMARAEFDEGAAPADLPAQRMVMLLGRAPEQQAALEKLLAEQQDRSSPNYMRWLTPTEFGQKFGPADADVTTIASWLVRQGFTVNGVSAGKTAIEFSGTAARVQQAFHTPIHQYIVNGRQYWANAQDPEIPAALAPVVRGVVSLNDFPRKRLSHPFGLFTRQADGTVTPEYTASTGSGSYYALAPGDFATIYNTTPLLQAGNNGAGQTIAVIGVSNVHLSDIASFRTLFNLGAGNTSVVIDGDDPGIVDGDEGESVLDLEWTSAVAPGATVMLVSAKDTFTTSGLDLAALHAIDNNLAGVLSMSYGMCEANIGTTENLYIQSLWEQAAAQGITVLVSSGDSGPSLCDYQSVTQIAQHGLAVNGMAATPYNVAVGGTDFNDVGTQTTYWSTTNDPTTHASAKSYIPETTWNSTCAAKATVGNLGVCPVMPSSGTPAPGSGLAILAASGGPSSCTNSTSSGGTVQCQSGTPKPSWQSGAGVPADGVRDLPDVSLFAAVNSNSRSFYIMCESDTSFGPVCQPGSSFSFLGTGGTSNSAAAFAGVVALADQKAGTRLGNLNPLLYSLAAQTGGSCRTGSGAASCMFNDVVSGNISVPCTAGTPNCSATSGTATGVEVDATGAPAYVAGTGYDLATGLGSVNVANLVNGVANAVKNASATSLALTLNGSTTAVTAQHGASIGVGVSVTPAASGPVSLLGKSAGIDSATLSSGTATWNSRKFPGGSYTVRAHYPGDATHAASDSNGVAVTINPEASQTLVNLVTFDANGAATNNATTAAYGSPYILHGAVADMGATVSAATGVSSTCTNDTASCATGTVTLTSNGSPLDGGSFTLNSKGFFEDWQIQLPAGSYNIAASYGGDTSYNASTGTAAVTITKAATTLAATNSATAPLQYGTPSSITFNVNTNSSGVAPTGTLSFNDNGAATTYVHSSFFNAQAGSESANANLSFQTWYAAPSVGTHALYATYSGDANYATSDDSASPLTVTVNKADTTIANYGSLSQTVALPTTQVTVSVIVATSSWLAAPTGTIALYDNGTPVNATLTYSPTNGTWTSPYGNNEAGLSANVTMAFATGTHVFTATYAGDSNYNGASGAVGTLTVYDKLPTTITLTPELNPTVINYATKLIVQVTGPYWSGLPAMSGTVSFTDNGQPLTGTVTYSTGSNGAYHATLPYTFTTTGAHSISASYAGDSTYVSGTVATPLSLNVVAKLTTTGTFSASGQGINLGFLNTAQPSMLEANIESSTYYSGPVMSGSVTFLDGGIPIPGTVQQSSNNPYPGLTYATLPYTFTTAGTHNITVQYSGDNYYAPFQQVFPVTVKGPMWVDLSNLNAGQAAAGGPGTVSGFVVNATSSPITATMSCTPDSSAATCSVTPSPVTMSALGMSQINVNYTVPALRAASRRHNPFTMPFVLAGVLVGLPLMTRKRRALMLAMIAVVLVLALTSCGGGGSGATSQPGNSGGTTNASTSNTYKFTVTATSGSNTDSQVLTVIVQ